MTFLGKLGWFVSLILAAVILAGAYVFLVRGNVVEGEDGRTVILLSKAERIKVLGEMRGMLEAVQSVTEAAATGDNAVVQAVARAVGMAATANESAAMMAKLPLEFKTLGFGTHKAWDSIADLAQTGATQTILTVAIGDILLNCTACHASYQFANEDVTQ